MKIKNFLLLTAFFVCGSFALQAQDYNSAIGLRLGSPSSISYKTFINGSHALEGYVGFRSYGFGSWINISGAYLVHNDIGDVDGLMWYYGGGVSAFFWNYDNDLFGADDYSSTSFGIQGYLGLDYKFDGAPVNISLDWIPTFFLGGDLNLGSNFGGAYGSLAVRYTLN